MRKTAIFFYLKSGEKIPVSKTGMIKLKEVLS